MENIDGFRGGFQEDNVSEEKIENKEKEIFKVKTVLNFSRHTIKEAPVEGAPKIDDQAVVISEAGKNLAIEKHNKTKIKEGSQYPAGIGNVERVRTKETAAYLMLGDELKTDMTFSEIVKYMRDNKVKARIASDARLDFNDTGAVGKAEEEAFDKNRFFDFLIKESDKLAIDTGDTVSSGTYSRYSGKTAEIIKDYMEAGDKFYKLSLRVKEQREQGKTEENYGNTMERFLVSHMGVLEPFVLKVLEKKFGEEKRDEYATRLGAGFKVLQGYQVEIINTGNEQKMFLTYEVAIKDKPGEFEKETIELDKKMIEEIIEEKNKFEKKVKANAEKISN